MWIWTSSVLLASLAVIGLSFPHHHEYNIPQVGNGQRSQYYVLHKDGTYKYGFDSGDGTFESVMSQSPNHRGGNFGYVDPSGNTIRLEYEAGVGGFVARGAHLPKPSPELAEALANVVRRSNPFVDPLAGSDGDKSYGFKFESDDYSRNEKANQDGTITGSYSYIDGDGILRSFTYRAGKGIGFVIEGDSLTQDVNTHLRSAPAVTNIRRTQVRQQSDARTRSSQVTNKRRFQTPSRPFGASFRQTHSYSGSETPVTFIRSENSGDASYRFNYNADDHSRSETADRDLNVEGSFSFIGDDGNRRTVNYNAGSGTGFVAQGDHFPVAPKVPDFGIKLPSTRHTASPSKPISTQISTSSIRNRGYKYQAPSASFKHGVRNLNSVSSSASFGSQHTGTHLSSSQLAPIFKSSSQFGENTRRKFANIRSSSSRDGSYEFSYDASSHLRRESGDSDINVDGKFAFISDDDNQQREITYEAGSDTGFIAKGRHIPVGPEVPGARSGQPTGDFDRIESVNFVDPLAGSDSDSSYNFDFRSDSYTRSERVDEDGTVVGTYTVVDDDGLSITYRYRAGKGIGYEVEEISRTQGPRPVRPTPYSGDLAFDDEPSFDVPGTPSFPSPGQSNYVHPHAIGSLGSTRSSSTIFKSPTFIKHSGIATGSTFRGGYQRGGHRTDFTSSKISSDIHKARSNINLHAFSPSSWLESSKSKIQPLSFSSRSSLAEKKQFPDFTLNTYPASPGAEKFGYVLRYD